MRRGAHAHDPISRIKSAKQIYTWINRAKIIVCASGRWKLDPKRSRKKLNLGPKRSIFVKIVSFCTPKDSFAVGAWEKYTPKRSCSILPKWKKGVKTAAHMYHPSHREYPPPPPPGRSPMLIESVRVTGGWTVGHWHSNDGTCPAPFQCDTTRAANLEK